MKKSFGHILHGSPADVAPRLLNSLLVRELDGQQLIGRVVETEAYDQSDAASHSYKGRTSRTSIMFGEPGHAYIYFTYGMHYCMNIVTGPVGYGAAVLIRALEPLKGIEFMRNLRHNVKEDEQLTNGPAKLCQAFGVDKRLNGHKLTDQPLQLLVKPALENSQIVQTTRIGITRNTELRWRFYIKDNSFVSKHH